MQRLANDITARLAQLAKDPPDLTFYLRIHAETITQTLHPIGLSYEMVSGNGLQRVLMSNLDSLEYRTRPEQEVAFGKAAKLAVQNARAVLIEPNTLPAEGLHGLKPEDSPAPDELPVFNRTPYHHFFIPILVGTSSVGVLHTWFSPSDANGMQVRQVLLKHACGEIELYLKARKFGDVSDELTRLTTYSRLLEELAGDLELESVTWNIVNFARESVACDRVCLFVATNYGRARAANFDTYLNYDYELFACSGLKKPHPRSEHAVILKGVARKLTEMALSRETQAPPVTPGQAPKDDNSGRKTEKGSGLNHVDASTTLSTKTQRIPSSTAPEVELNAKSGDNSSAKGKTSEDQPIARATVPQIQLTLIQRDPSKTATRPSEVNEYFEVLPMNWATVLPLFDRNNRVCGIVLFEGNRVPEKLGVAFLRMRDLAVSAGRALGTSLYWNKQRSLRFAHRWISTRERLVNTPARRLLVRFVLPVSIVIGILFFPMTYNVKGEASIIPATQHSLPVMTSSTLLTVAVKEGQIVAKSDVLATFDTTELNLLLRQALQEYQRALVDSDSALGTGNEAQMQMARLSAAKALAQAEKIENDIKNSTMRAPVAGMVLGAQSLANRIGEYVRQGESALQIVDPKRWQVKAALKEQDIAFMEKFLNKGAAVHAELKLTADPAHGYPLSIATKNQLTYGLDISSGKYFFGAVMPLELGEAQGSFLKSGFSGRVSFDVGRHALGYVLFRDFGNFIRLQFL